MKILLDNCMPRLFERLLPGHEVIHCSRLGWEQLTNGKLLTAAEGERFTVLVTVDRNMQFQQNMAGRSLTLVYLRVPNNSMAKLNPMANLILEGVEHLKPGTIVAISHPDMR